MVVTLVQEHLDWTGTTVDTPKSTDNVKSRNNSQPPQLDLRHGERWPWSIAFQKNPFWLRKFNHQGCCGPHRLCGALQCSLKIRNGKEEKIERRKHTFQHNQTKQTKN